MQALSAPAADDASRVQSAEALSELKRVHAAKQLALMSTIDTLREELQREQARADARAAELDATRRDYSADEMSVRLEQKRKECRASEDEALRLREEFNAEKCKVLELKRAAHSRAAEWKLRLEQLSAELAQKERLEDEVTALRGEVGRLRGRETQSQTELSMLRQEAKELRKAVLESRVAKEEEMGHLSRTMSGQLCAVEKELKQQTEQNSQLIELFLRHAVQPLEMLRRCCGALAKELSCSPSLRELRLLEREVPPMYDVDLHDLKGNLVKVINLLRYTSHVLETREVLHTLQESEKPDRDKMDATQVGGWFRGVFASQ